jgi:hypothetical protein
MHAPLCPLERHRTLPPSAPMPLHRRRTLAPSSPPISRPAVSTMTPLTTSHLRDVEAPPLRFIAPCPPFPQSRYLFRTSREIPSPTRVSRTWPHPPYRNHCLCTGLQRNSSHSASCILSGPSGPHYNQHRRSSNCPTPCYVNRTSLSWLMTYLPNVKRSRTASPSKWNPPSSNTRASKSG